MEGTEATAKKKIVSFEGDYAFLLLDYNATIVYDGELYPTVENAFQAAKVADPATRSMLASLRPADANKRGSTVTCRPDWEQVKEPIMIKLLRSKFEDFNLQQKLLRTGDAILEYPARGKIWGIVKGVGENRLGVCLMCVRLELRGVISPAPNYENYQQIFETFKRHQWLSSAVAKIKTSGANDETSSSSSSSTVGAADNHATKRNAQPSSAASSSSSAELSGASVSVGAKMVGAGSITAVAVEQLPGSAEVDGDGRQSNEETKSVSASSSVSGLPSVKDTRFSLKTCDIFTMSSDWSLAHCVSQDLAMSKGIAVHFVQRYGGLDELKQQQPFVGGCCFIKRIEKKQNGGDDDNNNNDTNNNDNNNNDTNNNDNNNNSDARGNVYYLVTKARYSYKPTMTTLRESLVSMRQLICLHGVTKLAIPQIGCGLDGLRWPDVWRMVQQVFEPLKSLQVIACSPTGFVDAQEGTNTTTGGGNESSGQHWGRHDRSTSGRGAASSGRGRGRGGPRYGHRRG